MKKTKQIIIVEVENKPGVLTKVASLCRRRRYNIESLTVSTTKNPKISQITLVFFEEAERIRKIVNQIDKLIEVISVEVAGKNVIDKELILIIVKDQKIAQKLLAKNSNNTDVRIIKNKSANPIIEIAGNEETIENIISNLNFEKDILKIVRSGLVALKVE